MAHRVPLICCALTLAACGPTMPAPTGAVYTPSGVLVWVDADRDTLRLQRSDDSGWSLLNDTPRSSDFGTWWWLAGSAPADRYRLVEGRHTGPATPAEPLDETLSLSPGHGAVLAGEPLTIQLAAGLAGLPLAAHLDLDGAALSPGCLADGGLLDCVGEDASVSLGTSWSASVSASPAAPQLHTLQATIWLEDVQLDTQQQELLLVGRRMLWGDLHAHSGLSHDGCEDDSDNCVTRDPLPGADFFALASSAQLDFAAMTEHAELNVYQPADKADPLWVWDAQQAAVQAADGVVSVLGYEWTFARPQLTGGHKTVLLEEAETCDSRRISSAYNTDQINHVSGAVYFNPNNNAAVSNEMLWAMLDMAAADCPGSGRAVTFAHHSAWTPPEMVDWTDPINAPDPAFEPVIEIHSEHASSECADLSAEGCDWGIADDRVHHPEGAVQTALAQGYRLGFVGATDSHDGRPGSVEDGPSCAGRLSDTDADGIKDTIVCHTQDGALTGIFAGTSDLDRAALFDSLFARQTAATSGPRLPLRVALADSSGALHLPGAVVSSGDAELYVIIDDDDLDGLELIEAALLTPRNASRAWTDTLPAVMTVTLGSTEAVYLRLRLWDPEDAVEQRIWLSPWFTD